MNWVTYFPKFDTVHLTKDVGLVPFYAGINGFNATLLGHVDSSISFPEEVSGLNVEELNDVGKLFFLDKAFLRWLRVNAQKTDVLHLFHLSRDTIFYGAYFKRLNPRGKLYLKMDAYNDHLRTRKKYAKNPIKNALLRRTEKEFLKGLDLATIENRDGLRLVSKIYPELAQKMEYLPNGTNDHYLKAHVAQVKKEKIILSVGRLGSSDKNYELFLRALPKITLNDWKVVIVGPISQEYQSKIDFFFGEYPEFNDRVSFAGAIYDRKELYSLYARASVFFMPSRFESFGISFVEALYFGACLVGHKGMYAYDDISNDGEFGCYFEDNDPISLADSLMSAVEKSSDSSFASKASFFGQNTFVWSTLSRRLMTKLGYA
jgi:glycosyltransferase involved in cell wall biosynthesis